MKDIHTPRQIIQRIGRRPICKLLSVTEAATRKWYANGIPPMHWSKLVDEHGDWLSFETLVRANKVIRLPARRKNYKKMQKQKP